MRPWCAAGTRPSSSTVWAARASGATWPSTRPPPAAPRARSTRFLDSRPPLEMVFHLGAISDTTAADGDARLGDQCRAAAHSGTGAPSHGVRLIYASSAATYGDGAAGFDDDRLARRSTGCGRSTCMAGPSTPSTSASRAPSRRGRAAPAAMGRAQVLQRLWPERVPQGPHDLGGQGQARRGGRRRRRRACSAPTEPGLADGAQRRDFIWIGDVVDVMLWLLDTPERQRPVQRRHRPGAHLSATSPTRCATRPAVPRDIEFIDMPEALRGQYQSFTEATLDPAARRRLSRPVHAARGRHPALRAGLSGAGRPLR